MNQSEKFHYCWMCLFFVACIIFAGCNSFGSIPPDKARLCGKYSKEIYNALEDTSAKVQLTVSTQFATGMMKEEIPLNRDGTFSIDIPVVCATLCQITLDGYGTGFYLSPGQKTEFEMTKGISRNRNLKMIEGVGWTEEDLKEDLLQFNDIFKEIRPDLAIKQGISTEEYQQDVVNNLNKIKKTVDGNLKVLYDRKKSMIRSLKMSYLILCVLNTGSNDLAIWPQPLTKASDFTFLKYFGLNDSTAFNEDNYRVAIRKILGSEVFRIPAIDDIPLSEWLKKVKAIFSDLIGSDTGIFYDLLAANAYYLQLKNESKPFSAEQIKDIRTYFRNPFYAEELLKENENVIKHPNIRELPNVGIDKLMDAIVSQNKGKVVVVDFWATWCRPCMAAMNASKEMKKELEDKNVVFVYLSDPSSDKKLWEETAKNEKGVHYLIDSESDWNFLSKTLNFRAIPHYLIYDTNGQLKKQFIAYPGPDAMREEIEKLLQSK